MKEDHHGAIVKLIKEHSGKATKHTFQDNYLGNEHPRYPISNPVMRTIGKAWMQSHRDLTANKFGKLLTSLVKGESGTEKMMAGILMDYARTDQLQFNPKLFDTWLGHLVGWAEVDMVCTGKYTHKEILGQWKVWKPLLDKLSKSNNINKRRASLVLLCAPVRKSDDDRLSAQALQTIERLKSETEVLITKAISWLLRSMDKYHKPALQTYMDTTGLTLPKNAYRETLIKLKTGVKNKRKEKDNPAI